MSLMVEWRSGHTTLGTNDLVLISLPGVGNIGKAALEALNDINLAEELARLHHTALPPLATLDEDGLLSPPHLSVRSIESSTKVKIITITGTSQPLESQFQGQMAREVMEFLKKQGANNIIVLAGMTDVATRKDTFIVSSSASFRMELEAIGADVRRDEPSSGAIGMAALLASYGPLYDLNSACAIATTVGASGDIHASQRLLEALDKWFQLSVALPKDAKEKLSKKLASMAPNKTADHVSELTETPDAFYM
jgi:proteasome assembly chaperone (PAC2) family protein